LLKQLLGDLMKTTNQGDEELKLHDDHKGNVRRVIEKILQKTMRLK